MSKAVGKVLTKTEVRNLIVKLVMGGWTKADETKFAPRFKNYVKSLWPDADVVQKGESFSIAGVSGVKCTTRTEAGVWAMVAKELAR